jgi:hypothetical protein
MTTFIQPRVAKDPEAYVRALRKKHPKVQFRIVAYGGLTKTGMRRYTLEIHEYDAGCPDCINPDPHA